ncbi:MAG: IPT/TIG domain-containing protein [Terracidiphilus sp.]
MWNPCQIFGVGNCDITIGRIVTVYWDTSLQQFDLDVTGPSNIPTHEAIDEYVAALLQSSYLEGLTQYGVANTLLLPSLAGGAQCTPSTRVLSDLNNNPSDVDTAIKCVLANNPSLASGPGQLVINFVLPPSNPADLTFCQLGQPPGEQLDGWHAQQSQAYTIIPIGCDPNLTIAERGISHELVETLTDPNSGAGWTDWSNGDEIADECELTASATAPFLSNFGLVSEYWSNNASSCISSLNPTPPTITTETVCGSGPNMTITVNGTFPFPSWDISNGAFSGQTPYVAVTVTRPSGPMWTAGLPVSNPGNQLILPVEFASLQENASQVTINGFNSVYGTEMNGATFSAPPGSSIVTTAINPPSGAGATSPAFVVPSPSQISGFDVFPGPTESLLYVNNTAQVWGQVQDGGRCGDAAIPVVINATAGSFPGPQDPITLTSDALGNFSTTYTAPSTAGMVTVAVQQPVPAQIQVPVFPVVTSIQPSVGSVNGSQPVTIFGNGFAAPASVSFAGMSVNVPSTSVKIGTLAFLTPALQSASLPDGYENVNVVVTDNQVQASQEGLTFKYVVPFAPVQTDTQPQVCGLANLTVTGYDSTGNAILNGNPNFANFRINLSVPANWITGPSGPPPTNALTIQSGQTVQVSSGGPFTAVSQLMTNGAWVNQGTTIQTFPFVPSTSVICQGFSRYGPGGGFGGPGGFSSIFGTYGSNVALPPGILKQKFGCDFCTNPSQTPILWQSTQGGLFFTATGEKSLAAEIEVSTLDAATSQKLLTERSLLIVNNYALGRELRSSLGPNARPALGARPPAGAQFRSPIVQISYKHSLVGALPAGLRLSVPRATAGLAPGSHLELYRQVPDGDTFIWLQDGITNQRVTPAYVEANITEAGSYVVVEVQN